VANAFTWSISRHEAFAACRRRYFYAYYAAQSDPEVQRLKKLSALPLWAGSVVHETIETLLKTRDTLPSPDEQEAIVHATVHDTMVSQWRQSEGGSPGFRLFEHEYQVPVDPEDKKIAVTTVRRSLRSFFRSEALREAFAVGRSRWLTVEDLVSFEVEGVPVYLRMDLAYRDSAGPAVIVDWKTGRAEGRFGEVQIAAYALYALSQGWADEPEQIRTELAYLMIPRFVRRAVSGRSLARARAFVARSAGRMRALLADPVANLARRDDFPMIDRPRVCRRCNFRRLCFPRDEAAMPEDASATMAAPSRMVESTARRAEPFSGVKPPATS
jgi:hypothetical protein